MVYAVADVRMGGGQPDADKGKGVKNYPIFADVLYGRPLAEYISITTSVLS